jgi:3-oxoacyl-[acyl-carrier-protein] synthase-3
MPATAETVARRDHFVKMRGRELFKLAVRGMGDSMLEALGTAGLTAADLELVIPHQANLRIIDAAARALKLPMERFILNVDKYGNTSTASIPMAVCEAAADGRIKTGDTLVLVGFGAGLTWGALAAKWSGAAQEQKVQPWIYRILARARSSIRRVSRTFEGIIWGRKG